MVQRGAIGEPRLVHGSFLQDWLFYPTDWNWRLEPHLGGDLRAVSDIGTHWLDLAELIALGGGAIQGPWDGEEAITLMADLDAGATGAMTGGGYPDGIRQIIDPYFAGRRDEAAAAYQRWLPLINYENRQCGLAACKALMTEGRVIKHETVRLPLQPLHPVVRAGLIEIASHLDPLVLRWGK